MKSVLEELRQSSGYLGIRLNCSSNAVLNRLGALGKGSKDRKWFPNKLLGNIFQRSTNCISVLKILNYKFYLLTG